MQETLSMAGSLRLAVVALAALGASAAPARAFGGGSWSGRTGYSPAYSMPMYSMPMHGPIYFYPLPASCEFMPPPYLPPSRPANGRPAKERSQPLVKPIPKDTKQTAEPPGGAKRAPVVTESRSLGGGFPEPAPRLPQGMARVGFWNITGRDLTLSIDGRTRTLAKDRAITVDVERSFTWQVNDGALHTERVPGEQNTFEVIIRP
jgi:hypothetical protein